jgi:hypothetical protein
MVKEERINGKESDTEKEKSRDEEKDTEKRKRPGKIYWSGYEDTSERTG